MWRVVTGWIGTVTGFLALLVSATGLWFTIRTQQLRDRRDREDALETRRAADRAAGRAEAEAEMRWQALENNVTQLSERQKEQE